ncbi:hypothetical protein K0U27_04860 [archaeon]|nr:hypothetical protein [archaeon]
MNKLFFFLFLLALSFPSVFAEDLVMHVDQSEYYFQVGENAIIPLEIENNYGQQISGMLQYTISQQIIQSNTQISSSNTQASAFVIDDGNQTVSLEFGIADSPSTRTASLNFIYHDEGIQTNVSLDPITIHFVSDASQKNNIENRMQSSSKQGSSSQNNPSNQQQQSIQQKLDELMNQESNPSQDPQQRLQNSQLVQDSSSLKKEIQRQLQEENNLKQEFEKQLLDNEIFLKSHQQFLQQGYNATSANMSPISSSTGDFEINYENKQGKWAKIHGSMVNGTLTDVEKQTQEEQDKLVSKLREDADFQEYEKQLASEGFTEQHMKFISHTNMTSLSLEYQNEEIQMATITAEFDGDELTKIYLEKSEEEHSHLPYVLSFISLVVIGYFLYKKLRKSKTASTKPTIPNYMLEKPDYVLASNNLIHEAEDDFQEKRYKDAYGKVSKSIRLFLSYELNLNREITNEDILLHLANTKYSVDDIEHCFRLSSLVEFAKHHPDKKEFDEIITMARNIIRV